MAQEKKVDLRDIALRWAKIAYPLMTHEDQMKAESFFPELKKEELTEFEKAVKQVMEETIECGDIHNLKADAEMLYNLARKPVDVETSPTWEEHDEMIRKVEEAFVHSLEQFFPRRKLGWRLSPPK